MERRPRFALPSNAQLEEHRPEDEFPEGGVRGWFAVLGG